MHTHRPHAPHRALLATCVMLAAAPAIAADVTPERLINADREPQNWLMNHRTYDAQRYSPLGRINKANAKDLKLAYAVAIGGTAPNENLQATPLAEDGFLYVVDQWGVLYVRETSAASSGAWTRGRKRCRCRTAAPPCGAGSSSRSQTIRRA
jgi:alcohol dehydrogenase (cytochrome c)